MIRPPAEVLDHGYWEERARRFAGGGRGLRAVCSYGMPVFYNGAIDATQYSALRPWLRVRPGQRVLDLGCGVGRWSRRLARRGARVTGLDLSPTMIEQARSRARREGLSDLCDFEVSDVTALGQTAPGPFDRVLAVTVLQHVTDEAGVDAALRGIAARLAPGGDVVLLEVAPGKSGGPTEHARLRVRDISFYRDRAAAAGLTLRSVSGVDLPLTKWYLPLYGRLPRWFGVGGLALLTAVTLPLELTLARYAPAASWHKVMVFERTAGAGGATR